MSIQDGMTRRGSGKRPTPKRTKIQTILGLFFSGARLNRFEAERFHDHCLHSTVSTLEGFGLVFDRKWESVPCVNSTERTRCKRYWLSRTTENVSLASALLNQWGGA